MNSQKLLLLLSAVFCFLVLPSCSDDDTSKTDEYSTNYFSIEGATFHEGVIPESTSTTELEGVSFNEQALSGGMNFIVINSDKNWEKFYIGTEGVDGYWEYNPEVSRSNRYVYTIPVMYGTQYNQDIVMILIGIDQDGNVSIRYICPVSHVDSESGDININLTFSTPKDVDLHLYTPSGEHIYYGNRGGYVTINDEEISYGLDHDSNPACHIDNLNNENIYIPAELVENGEYRVVVDLYSNCTSAYDTSWAVVARYKGNIIENEYSGYSNPALGNYSASAPSGDHTTIMTFTISDAPESRSASSAIRSIRPAQISDAEQAKIEFEALQ